jgi:hypothetical protein
VCVCVCARAHAHIRINAAKIFGCHAAVYKTLFKNVTYFGIWDSYHKSEVLETIRTHSLLLFSSELVVYYK